MVCLGFTHKAKVPMFCEINEKKTKKQWCCERSHPEGVVKVSAK